MPSTARPPAPLPPMPCSRGLELLLARLGPEPEAGLAYERLRQRLGGFFAWRGADFVEELADETLDRVARRLEAGHAVEHLRGYVFGVARRVLQEWRKRRARRQAWQASSGALAWPSARPALLEQRVACLECCLDELPGESRRLIVAYYQGPGRHQLLERRQLAARLGLSYTALTTRAYRIRGQLARRLRSRLAEPQACDRWAVRARRGCAQGEVPVALACDRSLALATPG